MKLPKAPESFAGTRLLAVALSALTTFAGAAACVAPLGAQENSEAPDPPPQLGVWRASVAGFEVTESVLPDVPIAASSWPGGGLAVLTRPAVDDEDPEAPDPDELPRALHRVRGVAADLEPVVRDLPAGTRDVHRAGETLWLGGDSGLYRLDADGVPSIVKEGPGVDLRAMARSGLFADGELWLPEVGRLLHVRPNDPADGDGWQLLDEASLPVRATRQRRRLTLRSNHVTRLSDGTLIVGPEPAGKTRIQHLMLGDGEPVEAWSRLPRPEDVERSWYALLNGEPVFIAATTEADRLGVFEKLELRLFRLKADRTRAGRTPVLAVGSETLHWNDFEPKILDWNGDGKDDLALVQPDGMGPGNLVVELYLGRLARFEPKAKSTKFDAESATWNLGPDFDGDGIPDIAVGTGSLSIHRGVEHRRKVLEKDPWKSLTRSAFKKAREEIATVEEDQPTTDDRPSFRGRIRVEDFTGDGQADIAVVRRSLGRSVVRIVQPTP